MLCLVIHLDSQREKFRSVFFNFARPSGVAAASFFCGKFFQGDK